MLSAAAFVIAACPQPEALPRRHHHHHQQQQQQQQQQQDTNHFDQLTKTLSRCRLLKPMTFGAEFLLRACWVELTASCFCSDGLFDVVLLLLLLIGTVVVAVVCAAAAAAASAASAAAAAAAVQCTGCCCCCVCWSLFVG